MSWTLADLDYRLPSERIAQRPVDPRDAARLLGVDRRGGPLRHGRVSDLPGWLRRGDLLIGNATRVRTARLRGRKESGGAAEALLLGPMEGCPGAYRALLRHTGRLRAGLRLVFGLAGGTGSSEPLAQARVAEVHEDGSVVLIFGPPYGDDPYALGEMPLPPYIRRDAPEPQDEERYQTVFAREPGAVAAPTAGLHFTPELLAALQRAGVGWAEVVLHVGAGTFRPLTEEMLATGELHAEDYELPSETAAAIEATRRSGGRVVAVGTTSCRVLETCATPGGCVQPGRGRTRLFLRPGSTFRVVDGLVTNLHLPRSSLLLLVAAFAGRERVLAAYREAIASGYRFYSYGDAMLLL